MLTHACNLHDASMFAMLTCYPASALLSGFRVYDAGTVRSLVRQWLAGYDLVWWAML